jgi:hypothetical protein
MRCEHMSKEIDNRGAGLALDWAIWNAGFGGLLPFGLLCVVAAFLKDLDVKEALQGGELFIVGVTLAVPNVRTIVGIAHEMSPDRTAQPRGPLKLWMNAGLISTVLLLALGVLLWLVCFIGGRVEMDGVLEIPSYVPSFGGVLFLVICICIGAGLVYLDNAHETTSTSQASMTG